MYAVPELKPCHSFSRIAVLTSGGDAPGMNAAVRAVVRTAIARGIDCFGVHRGYSGLVDGDIRPMTSRSVKNIIQRGGTILKSDRCLEFKEQAIRWQAYETLTEMGIDALVVIGGDGSLTGAKLFAEETGMPVIGLPGTIDNDIPASDDTIGFDTAVNTALDAIDRIRDTADSHGRVFLVEVMGRNSGHIASEVGIAGGADFVVLPETEVKADTFQELSTERTRFEEKSALIIVAEGENEQRIHQIADDLKQQGHEPRICILGHTQRGGSPTGHDRVLASGMGAIAVEFLLAGYGCHMVGVRSGAFFACPLDEIQLAHPESAAEQSFDSLWRLLK